MNNQVCFCGWNFCLCGERWLKIGLALLSTMVIFSGCTDAQISSVTSLGSSGHVTCYSGGKIIFEGDSTGKISTVMNSDGWEFREASTGKFVRVSGSCVIKN